MKAPSRISTRAILSTVAVAFLGLTPAAAQGPNPPPPRLTDPNDWSVPFVTAYQGRATVDETLAFLRRLGANHVWIGPKTDEAAARRFREAGFHPVHVVNPCMRTGRVRNFGEWVHCFLRGPWIEAAGGPLTLPVMAPFDPDDFIPAPDLTPGRSIWVQRRSDGAWLDASKWRAKPGDDNAVLPVPVSGEAYRVVFLAGLRRLLGRGSPAHRFTDGTAASVRPRHMQRIGQVCREFPSVGVLRPTTLIYPFLHIEDAPDWDGPSVSAYSWHAYWTGVRPERLARYEERFGRPFDPRILTDAFYGEEGVPPSPAYRDWIALIREDIVDYARELNAIAHDAGRRSRLFYGDNWLGLEPALGDLDRAGFDEIVTSLNRGAGTVRWLTDFPSRARRIARFPWVKIPADASPDRIRQFHEDVGREWRWIKREMLWNCPDGLTIGGAVDEAFRSTAGDALVEVAAEFRVLHERCFGRRPYRHDWRVAVVDAWGAQRAWSYPCHYASRQTVPRQMLGWPVDVDFLRFDEVAENGLPNGIRLVIIAGEPDTAWSGGPAWDDPRLLGRLEAFVRDGGGLLAIGGAGVVGERHALADLLGIQYAGRASKEAERNLWNRNRWVEAGRPRASYRREQVTPRVEMKITPELVPDRIRPHLGDGALSLLADILVRPAGARPLTSEATLETGVFLREVGKGRAGYIGGYGAYGDFFKAFAFHLAGKDSDLERLDTDNDAVVPYLWPDRNWLALHNAGAGKTTVRVSADPVLVNLPAGTREASLTPLDGGPALKMTAGGRALRTSCELAPGETRFFTARP